MSSVPGNQRLVHRRAARELHPFGLEVEAELLALRLEQALLLDDGERQIGDAELLGEAHRLRFREGMARREHRESGDFHPRRAEPTHAQARVVRAKPEISTSILPGTHRTASHLFVAAVRRGREAILPPAACQNPCPNLRHIRRVRRPPCARTRDRTSLGDRRLPARPDHGDAIRMSSRRLSSRNGRFPSSISWIMATRPSTAGQRMPCALPISAMGAICTSTSVRRL